MTEFEIRRSIEAIRISPASPVTKARELLRLRRKLAIQHMELERASKQVGRTPDLNSQAMLNRMAATAEGLEDDMLESARELLKKRRQSITLK